MRLIDADKIDFNEVFVRANDFARDTREAAQSLIDAQPTIEAAPVVYSEWEICEEPNVIDTLGNPATYARCRNCGFGWRNKYHAKNYFKHCPNCGANMKGGAE